ncbi:MAG: CZB domain-containing protein [Thermodesulfovibrionales bacterium]|nr:CZB domain-containing protein [Thermodesulfovibrionales bacterium]
MLDIMIARLTHVEWVDQLERALQKKDLILNVKSFNECDLGIWLYSGAIKEYRDIPEIELLERYHKEFHIAAEKVVRWHNSPRLSPRQDAQAQIDFEEAQRMSKEIIYLLTMLEYKMLRNYQSIREPQEGQGITGKLFKPFKKLFGGQQRQSSAVSITKVSLDMLKDDLRGKG